MRFTFVKGPRNWRADSDSERAVASDVTEVADTEPELIARR